MMQIGTWKRNMNKKGILSVRFASLSLQENLIWIGTSIQLINQTINLSVKFAVKFFQGMTGWQTRLAEM